MKKAITLIILSISCIFSVIADSESLKTEILSVSFGPHNFGYGLAPIGTDYRYYNYFQIHESLPYKAYFETRINFSFPNDVSFRDYDYKKGTPYWIKTYQEYKANPNFLYGTYFNPTVNSSISVSQGFGTNPVAGKNYLVKLSLTFNTRYSLVLEELNVNRGEKIPVFFNPATNEYNAPFGPGSNLPAFPWLQDNRQTLSNYLSAKITLNLTKNKGYSQYDGLDSSLTFEYGPAWLGNTLSMKYATSDYYRIRFDLKEYLALYTSTQSNGWNWLSIGLVHQNSITHTGGTIIPKDKLPSDRLENAFTDSLYFKFYGPQFIAQDCVTDITLGLYNNCYFGHVVNESSKETIAMEWTSSIELAFHMRLFGFMHFRYKTWYDFGKGIKARFPQLNQEASVTFYISL